MSYRYINALIFAQEPNWNALREAWPDLRGYHSVRGRLFVADLYHTNPPFEKPFEPITAGPTQPGILDLQLERISAYLGREPVEAGWLRLARSASQRAGVATMLVCASDGEEDLACFCRDGQCSRARFSLEWQTACPEAEVRYDQEGGTHLRLKAGLLTGATEEITRILPGELERAAAALPEIPLSYGRDEEDDGLYARSALAIWPSDWPDPAKLGLDAYDVALVPSETGLKPVFDRYTGRAVFEDQVLDLHQQMRHQEAFQLVRDFRAGSAKLKAAQARACDLVLNHWRQRAAEALQRADARLAQELLQETAGCSAYELHSLVGEKPQQLRLLLGQAQFEAANYLAALAELQACREPEARETENQVARSALRNLSSVDDQSEVVYLGDQQAYFCSRTAAQVTYGVAKIGADQVETVMHCQLPLDLFDTLGHAVEALVGSPATCSRYFAQAAFQAYQQQLPGHALWLARTAVTLDPGNEVAGKSLEALRAKNLSERGDEWMCLKSRAMVRLGSGTEAGRGAAQLLLSACDRLLARTSASLPI